jgi:SAM-dependent methyltransferase
MAKTMNRRPLQGVWTVIRFNWHLHVMALGLVLMLVAAGLFLTGMAGAFALALAAVVLVQVIFSLVATWIAYDVDGLYRLTWLAPILTGVRLGANLHAGFDETTPLLKSLFPAVKWIVFDFYNPDRHTEISISRARAAHPPSAETVVIRTSQLPLADGALDCALLILAAHEIRDHGERVMFFRELGRVLRPGGRVIVTEHLRDPVNIIAYSVGAWHFHTRGEWLATFQDAGFRISREFRNNPLISTFVLEPHESPA